MSSARSSPENMGNIEYAKRPAHLDKIIKILDKNEEKEKILYSNFLKMALQSTEPVIGMPFSVTYKHFDASSKISTNTSSLCYIFHFYAKIQSPRQKLAAKNPSYDAVQEASESLSFFELLVFCRDFRIIPKFLTKEELIFICKLINLQKAKLGQRVTRLISLENFKDILARIALLAFNKPGMKRLIIISNGVMPSIHDQIFSLAIYLHLDDETWVKNRIRTTGRETVGRLNFRSVGEKNTEKVAELREDLKGKRFARVLAHLNDPEHELTGGEEIDVDGEEASQVEKIAEAMQMKVTGVPSPRKEDKKVHFSPFDEVAEAINQDINEYEKRKDANDASVQQTLPSNVLATGAIITAAQEEVLLQYHPSLTRIFDQFSDVKAFMQRKVVTNDGVTSATFLDMGIVKPNSRCVIRLQVVNTTGHEVRADVTALNFPLHHGAIKITQFPNAFAPGMSRTIYVSFVFENASPVDDVPALHIELVCPYDKYPSVAATCPVFFRVRENGVPRALELPTCAMSNLQRLLEKHVIEKKDTVALPDTIRELVNLQATSPPRRERGRPSFMIDVKPPKPINASRPTSGRKSSMRPRSAATLRST